MSSFVSDTVELKGLDQLVRALKASPPVIKIGIMGGGSHPTKGKSGKAPSNAEVGAAHEFGAPARGLPQRSFLRVPLTTNLNKELESSGLLDADKLAEVIKQGSIRPWVDQVSIVALGVVDDAFETSGDGQWPTWCRDGYSNGGGMLLVDTGSLRESITSEVSG